MGALKGLRVLDLSRVLAGPFCTQTLADLGAEVWKVEPPRGDDTRAWGPPFLGEGGVAAQGESAYYLSCNRGKKSLVVNLKDPRGQEIVRELARRADVLVENFKTGDLARYGLDYPRLAQLNPGLVYLSITGYGHTGPRAAEPGYDVAVQGLCGIMSVTGDPEGPPMRVPVAWVDLMTGMQGAIAVLAALQERARSGRGQHIDLALFDVGLAAMVNLAQSYLATGELPPRLGNAHPQIVPYGAFEAADGWFMLTIGNDEQYRRACQAVGQEELWEDPRFQTNAGRVQHRAELLPRLEALFRTRPRRVWLERFKEAGVPATPVNNLAEALAEPQVAVRGMVQRVRHPRLGSLSLLGSPLAHFSRTPARVRAHPPMLGEHTEEVLCGVLGMSRGELEALEAAGVVATLRSAAEL
ncbi:MAG: CoA transferase [Meiothermus sp.]|uniref:CaiB/BaiF CoA transferase family protein n=1 Tax=Meiothermus sp. TaxID=1955249 RepID=UPI0025D315FC|nr:CoA transferase [Meiothermus sp.]MCS7058123.1 CoA transferase [Meiothermus sp.]MCS7194354.1 CoA transferase [Meiothermus sp.]MCX7739909.1 CoA transferase [Meiothermus sp.]MDW8089835.1 CoA transferase [Meiothermus sp.]MDW8481738.1 CoA transferase [Meiothermus sp.]